MGFLPDELYAEINNSQDSDSESRLNMFEKLAQHVSLIPVRGGFPNEGEESRGYKAATEQGWSKWCSAKRPFNRQDFSSERAGIACGPASRILVLDIDDWAKFDAWLSSRHGKPDEYTNTFLVQSRENRGHIYFKYPTDGLEYRNKAHRDGGFDIRGLGGYVLCPGSLHPETKTLYSVLKNLDLASPPQWLLDYMQGQDSPKQPEKEIGDTFIDPLPIPYALKAKITDASPVNDRSRKSMEVMIELVANKIDDAVIKQIYAKYPIGEKVRENDESWFLRELDKAKEYVAQNNIKSIQDKKSISAEYGKITVYNALDIVSKDTDFEFMIDNIWPKGEPLLITGIGGAGKSLMTLQLAMDLVNPPVNGFLNTYRVNPQNNKHRILFIQSENSFSGMKKRFSVIRDPNSGYTIDDSILRESLFFAGMGNDITSIGNLEDKAFIDGLSRKIEETKADIIVVDPLISFHNKDENSNDQMRKILDILTGFCQNMSVTPLLVHHHGKFASETGQGGGRGASAIGDWSPNTWELSKNKNGFTFAPKKTRNFETPDDIKLELHYLRFRPLGGTGIDDNLLLVIQALKGNNGKFDKQSDFTAAMKKTLENQNKEVPVENTLRSYIASAVKKGLVIEKKEGRSKIYEINKDGVKKYQKI